ncbi:MAG: alpha-glucosidase/alpha-galactosidase [Lentisphaerae bacterium]|jgi:alpha-galactosidase|nr:alpha-glucosidase/alpha-galactosidase [Lentisphaerota bacterium]
MTKIAFFGAGSTIFVKNILGDVLCTPALQDAEIALYDINPQRLKESMAMLTTLNRNINQDRATIKGYCGVENRREALQGADFAVNAIRVWDFTISEAIDFAIPTKYGLRQTIADTIGIGGLFRALGSGEHMLHFAEDMADVCPNAWFLNYTNPMCALTGLLLRHTPIKTVGLCHSVQACVPSLLNTLGIAKDYDIKKFNARIGGINHQAWLLQLLYEGKDIYPQIKQIAFEKLDQWRKAPKKEKSANMVRLEIMRMFGYYVTESSEHSAEYMPYWIKRNYPELIEEYNIPLDASPNRCRSIVANWNRQYKEICENPVLTHNKSNEFGCGIMESIVTGTPFKIAGNVLNNGLIDNLPREAVVEVPCLVDNNGVQGTYFGRLPTQCAALNLTNINTQLLTIEAMAERSKDKIYQAALLDPHASAELSPDDIIRMVDEMLEAHKDRLPKYN